MANKEWYLYFDLETGQITRITPVYQKKFGEYIKIDETTAKEFYSNEKRPKDYRVAVGESGYELLLQGNTRVENEKQTDKLTKLSKDIQELLLHKSQPMVDLVNLPKEFNFSFRRRGKKLTLYNQHQIVKDYQTFPVQVYVTEKLDPSKLLDAPLLDLAKEKETITLVKNETPSVYIDVGENMELGSLFGSFLEKMKDTLSNWNLEGLTKQKTLAYTTDQEQEESLIVTSISGYLSQAWKDFIIPRVDARYEFSVLLRSEDAEHTTFAVHALNENGSIGSVHEATFNWSNHWIFYGKKNVQASFEKLDSGYIRFYIRFFNNEKYNKIRCQIWPSGINANNAGSVIVKKIDLRRFMPKAAWDSEDYIDLNKISSDAEIIYDPFKLWKHEGIDKELTKDEIVIRPNSINSQIYRDVMVHHHSAWYCMSCIINPYNIDKTQFTLKLISNNSDEILKESNVIITWPDKWLYYNTDDSYAEFEILDKRRICFTIWIYNKNGDKLRCQIWPTGYDETERDITDKEISLSDLKIKRVKDEQDAD